MDFVGEQVQSVLKECFPDLEISACEANYNQTLHVSVGDSVVYATPATLDYRRQDYRFWVHRFRGLLNTRLGR